MRLLERAIIKLMPKFIAKLQQATLDALFMRMLKESRPGFGGTKHDLVYEEAGETYKVNLTFEKLEK